MPSHDRRGRPRAIRPHDQARHETAFLLRAAGLSTACVASALGVSVRTVQLDTARASRYDTPMVRLAKAALHLPEFRREEARRQRAKLFEDFRYPSEA